MNGFFTRSRQHRNIGLLSSCICSVGRNWQMCASLMVRRERRAQSFFSIKGRIQEGILWQHNTIRLQLRPTSKGKNFAGNTAESGRNITQTLKQQLQLCPVYIPPLKRVKERVKLMCLKSLCRVLKFRWAISCLNLNWHLLCLLCQYRQYTKYAKTRCISATGLYLATCFGR